MASTPQDVFIVTVRWRSEVRWIKAVGRCHCNAPLPAVGQINGAWNPVRVVIGYHGFLRGKIFLSFHFPGVKVNADAERSVCGTEGRFTDAQWKMILCSESVMDHVWSQLFPLTRSF